MERKLKPKQQRRLARHLRNVAKDQQHKKEAWESGKLIKPNHNNNAYDKEYSDELGRRLVERIKNAKELSQGDNEFFISKFRLYKKKCIEYILHYDMNYPPTEDYNKIKLLLETYWDDRNNLINVII